MSLQARVLEDCADDLLVRFEVIDTGIGIAAQSINMSDGGWRWPWLYLAVAVASWCAAIGYWTQAEDDGTVHGPR